ncbi:MAG: phospho-sugar mutase [Cyclobacteriaceae bacterium]|nr:phospho-sugar mutase [Cyclobacteriaceae bacterium]
MEIEEIIKKANQWLDSPIDEESKKQIRGLLENQDKTSLIDSFYKDLEFGTGGLRGIMGIGSNRINKYTIGKATQGLANYLLKNFPICEIKVAIAYDSRNNSKLFSDITANVLSANGIAVYIFEDLRPTPELSFAIRELGCKSGVVITASHNPKEYNGYKAYWSDGAQLTFPHDEGVIKEVNEISHLSEVNFEGNNHLITILGEDFDEKYLKKIQENSLLPDVILKHADIPIVYSPIHGTGSKLVPMALQKIGFNNIYVVEEQQIPDGNFPTVIYPNPEESEALSMALKKGKEVNAQLVMATDPDSDRVGIAVQNNQGEFILLNGNQTGSLIIKYLLEQWKKNNLFKGNEYIVKTIVTTELIRDIADSYQTKCYDTLTGFKYIATLIRELEGKEKFIGGGEESYGYLIGDFVRDKDAIAACAIIAELAAYTANQNISLYSMLLQIYEEYGLYYENLHSLTKHGKQGAEEIEQMMKDLRNTPPEILGGEKVLKMIDYNTGMEKNFETGKLTKINFPKSNVLQFITKEGSKISARPSGTEPKIKFYFSVCTNYNSNEDFKVQEIRLKEKIISIKKDLMLS